MIYNDFASNESNFLKLSNTVASTCQHHFNMKVMDCVITGNITSIVEQSANDLFKIGY